MWRYNDNDGTVLTLMVPLGYDQSHVSIGAEQFSFRDTTPQKYLSQF